MIRAIIGLGNPGAQYTFTRHNIGFRIIDLVAETYDGIWSSRPKMELAEIVVNNKTIYLIKPTTYMNNSGEVIPFLLKKGIKPEEILVIHDEMEKKFGTVTLSQGTSHKGHNGLKSIMNFVSNTFHKLRCGVGRPQEGRDVGDYVLSTFTEDKKQLNDFEHAAASKIIELLNQC